MATSVLIVNRSRLERLAIARAINDLCGFSLASMHKSLDKAFRAIVKETPEVIVISSAETDDFRALPSIRSASAGAKIVVSGVRVDDRNVVACAQAGANGYIRRDASEEEWIRAIEGAILGEITDSRVAGILNEQLRQALVRLNGQGASSPTSSWNSGNAVGSTADRVGLTPRERQILGLVDRGMSNKSIARELSVEVSTVKNHIHSILGKYRVKRRSEAAAHFRATEDKTDPLTARR